MIKNLPTLERLYNRLQSASPLGELLHVIAIQQIPGVLQPPLAFPLESRDLQHKRPRPGAPAPVDVFYGARAIPSEVQDLHVLVDPLVGGEVPELQLGTVQDGPPPVPDGIGGSSGHGNG